MFIRISFSITILIASITASSQTVTVRNLNTSEYIENVALYSSDKLRSTISNEKGEALLTSFHKGDTITFQHPSYVRFSATYEQIMQMQTIRLQRKIIIIPEFVKTATKHSENKQNIPYKVDILTPRKLDLAPSQNSADILANTGNIFIQKSQVGGGSPVLRGFEANRIVLVVDGVKLNNAIYRSGHLQNSLTIDNDILERVEIIYGPSSVIYGSDALGGVIHYITCDPLLSDSAHALIKANASIQYGSANSSFKNHLDFNIGGSNFASLTSFTRGTYSDIRIGSQRAPYMNDWGLHKWYVQEIDGVDSVISNSNQNKIKLAGYVQNDLMQKFKYKPKNNFDFILNLQYSTTSNLNRHDQLNNLESNELPEFTEWYYGPQDRWLGSLKTTLTATKGLFSKAVGMVSYQNVEESRHTRAFRADTLTSQLENVEVSSASIDFVKLLNNSSGINYGFDITRNHVSSEAFNKNIGDNLKKETLTRYPNNGTNTFSAAAYLAYKAGIGDEIITSAGVRAQYYTLDASYGNLYYDLPEIFRNIELTDKALTGTASLIYKPGDSFKSNITLSTGFRSPNLDDLAKIRLTSGKLTLPNPDLESEYTYNAELGFTKTFDGYIQLSANYFFTYLNNIIIRTPYTFDDGADTMFFQGRYRNTYVNTNAEQGLIQGLSVHLLSDLNSNVSFMGTLNFTKGLALPDLEPLAHISPVFGRINMTYELDNFLVDIYCIYSGWKKADKMVFSGEDKDDEALSEGFPGWYTLNINTSYKITQSVSFQLAIENFTDNFYKPFASGVPAPGINFVGTLRVKL